MPYSGLVSELLTISYVTYDLWREVNVTIFCPLTCIVGRSRVDSQDLGTGCSKWAIMKFLSVLFFQGKPLYEVKKFN